MKVIIEGHQVVVNKMSIYIDEKMEFQAVNLITEYGQKLEGCTYAVASRYSRERLEELYPENLRKFSPFIYLTEEEYEPIRDANNNDNKHHMRDVNNHDDYGYTDDMMEVMHDCELLCGTAVPDAFTAIVEEEGKAQIEKLIKALPAAMAALPEKQRRRIMMHVYEGKTFREIADIEGTKEQPINRSIQKAKKNLRDYLKQIS